MIKIVTCIIFFFCFLYNPNAFAKSASLSWDANTESDLAGYMLYYWKSGEISCVTHTSSPSCIIIPIGLITTMIIHGLEVGEIYNFFLTAYDTSGNESEASNIVNKTINADTTLPKDATNFIVVQSGINSYTLAWKNASDLDVTRVKIGYKFNGGIEKFDKTRLLNVTPSADQTHILTNMPIGSYEFLIHTGDSSNNFTNTTHACITESGEQIPCKDANGNDLVAGIPSGNSGGDNGGGCGMILPKKGDKQTEYDPSLLLMVIVLWLLLFRRDIKYLLTLFPLLPRELKYKEIAI